MENRPQKWYYRGGFVLHVSQQPVDDFDRVRRELMVLHRLFIPDWPALDRGGLIATGIIHGRVYVPPRVLDPTDVYDSPWLMRGAYGYIVIEMKKLPRCIPYRGALGLFDVPRSALQGYA